MLFIYCTFICFSYIVLSYVFHILYLSYTFRVIDTLFLVLVYLSSHSNAILLISCHALLSFSNHVQILVIFFICFMSANTLESDTGNNCMYPKVLSLSEAVISICIYLKVSSLYKTVTYVM